MSGSASDEMILVAAGVCRRERTVGVVNVVTGRRCDLGGVEGADDVAEEVVACDRDDSRSSGDGTGFSKSPVARDSLGAVYV